MPPGTLVLEQQYIGAVATGLFLEQLVENGSHDDLVFGANVASSALLGSTRHSLQGGPLVMRRHLHLPVIADPETDLRATEAGRQEITFDELENTAFLSGVVYERHRDRGRVSVRTLHRLGHAAGDTALWVAMLPHLEIGTDGTTAQVQQQVLRVGMNALENTRRLRKRVGSSLSLAMLGGRSGRLTSYVEERGSDVVYDALRDAQNEAAKLVDVEK